MSGAQHINVCLVGKMPSKKNHVVLDVGQTQEAHRLIERHELLGQAIASIKDEMSAIEDQLMDYLPGPLHCVDDGNLLIRWHTSTTTSYSQPVLQRLYGKKTMLPAFIKKEITFKVDRKLLKKDKMAELELNSEALKEKTSDPKFEFSRKRKI